MVVIISRPAIPSEHSEEEVAPASVVGLQLV